ncbi:MAG: DUF871 family protein [Erysipelotrichaceae bacterium]|nr:DUF871 family protein [Erysipelotrichaceae bacterium]
MHRLGISVYPEHSTQEKDFAYMELAARYGFTRIFTCLLSVKESKEELMKTFTAFMEKAHSLGFIVSVDTNPEVFKHLGATPFNLEPFAKMGVDIIRLDGHFGDMEDIAITQNPYNIAIEFNGSCSMALDLLIQRGANKHNMVVCHNFYPQRYSALGWDIFMNFTKKYKALGLPMAAFVSSNQENTFGPWPVYAGLPTCEIHRGLPIDLQMRHLLATNLVDDILVGNAFASEEELKAMAEVDQTKITFNLDCVEGISEVEKEVIYEFYHVGRGDASDYFVRSSIPRRVCKDKTIPARSNQSPVLRKGDVVIVNDNLAHYRGELEIILKDMPNDGERNLVGRIPEEELILLDLLKPEFPFGFIKKK